MKNLIVALLVWLVVGQAQADIKDALANPDRRDADKSMDAKRRPEQVLAFFGLKPGMKVIDVFAGDGYYSEIVSRVVGDTGRVTLYNNSPWDKFVGESVETRLANNRLPNVNRYVAPPEALIDSSDQYDMAIFILGMHDIYYVDEKGGWPAIDKVKFLKGIYKVLKKDGVLGVVDHNAQPGSDPAISSKRLHRIDPATIIRDLETVGFKLEAQSNILRNPHDNFDMIAFDPSVRRKTDRSVLLFRK